MLSPDCCQSWYTAVYSVIQVSFNFFIYLICLHLSKLTHARLFVFVFIHYYIFPIFLTTDVSLRYNKYIKNIKILETKS